MKVLLVTSWGGFCGIAEHSKSLIEAVREADPAITITPSAEALDPHRLSIDPHEVDLIHLNYHAALHSRWTPERILDIRRDYHTPVLVTYHDTGVPNSDQCKAIIGAASDSVVHEPYEDLYRPHYWRMGVPALSGLQGFSHHDRASRPILGTMGHDLPWKNWELMAESATKVGWGLLIYCPEMSEEHEQAIRARNPWTVVRRGCQQWEVLAGLSESDATAFTFVCANTGQSASILQGIGARKPVIAFSSCRQFRALYMDPLGREAIQWCTTFEEVTAILSDLVLDRFDTKIAALAEQDSWRHLGRKYVQLYRTLAPA